MTGHLFGPGDPGAAEARKDRQAAVRARLDRERTAEARRGQQEAEQPQTSR
jgi:hypothetical protein